MEVSSQLFALASFAPVKTAGAIYLWCLVGPKTGLDFMVLSGTQNWSGLYEEQKYVLYRLRIKLYHPAGSLIGVLIESSQLQVSSTKCHVG